MTRFPWASQAFFIGSKSFDMMSLNFLAKSVNHFGVSGTAADPKSAQGSEPDPLGFFGLVGIS